MYTQYLWDELGFKSYFVMPMSLLRKNKDELLEFTNFHSSEIQIIDGEAKRRERQMRNADAKVFIMGFQRFSDDWQLIGRIGMKTSARNQWYGKVSAIQRGTVNDEVALALPGGQSVVAVVTHESTETLGLAVGGEAVALVKASSVLLVADDGTSDRLSTRNRLRGTVSAAQRGAVNAEVSLTLEGGAVVTAVVTNESVAELGIAEGQALVAAFKASSVILGVTAEA